MLNYNYNNNSSNNYNYNSNSINNYNNNTEYSPQVQQTQHLSPGKTWPGPTINLPIAKPAAAATSACFAAQYAAHLVQSPQLLLKLNLR